MHVCAHYNWILHILERFIIVHINVCSFSELYEETG